MAQIVAERTGFELLVSVSILPSAQSETPHSAKVDPLANRPKAISQISALCGYGDKNAFTSCADVVQPTLPRHLRRRWETMGRNSATAQSPLFTNLPLTWFRGTTSAMLSRITSRASLAFIAIMLLVVISVFLILI